MRNTQAWAWLTAGVVALGLNGFYHDGGAEWAHRVAAGISDQADSVIERVSGRAEQLVAEARMAADRGEMAREEATSCPFSKARARVRTRIARTQTAVAHFDALSAREQAQVDRWQAEQDRIQARVQARVQAQIDRQMARLRLTSAEGVDPVEIRVACPRVRVNVPAVRIPAVNIPEVHIPQISIPRVTIPQIPGVRITAPFVSGDESDSGPI